MSRYTGPVNRKSRRLSFSTLENGKDIAKRPNVPGQHGGKRGKKYLTMVFNYKKNKKFVSCMVYLKSNLKLSSKELVR